MVSDKIYFASDVHLGSNIIEDPIITEKRFVAWLDSIKDKAKCLYLLGDIFDFWFEYKKVVPKGFVRFLGKIAEMNDAGVEIHFFIGNHDIWVFDYLQEEVGIILHKEPLKTEICGKKFYLAHGDGLGDKSRSFKIMRSVFRNPFCQALFASLPTNWGIGFGQSWSRSSRKKDIEKPEEYFGENDEHLVQYAKEYLKKDSDIDYFIFGHRHILLDLFLNKRTRIVILGDWIKHFSFAVFDGESLLLELYEP